MTVSFRRYLHYLGMKTLVHTSVTRKTFLQLTNLMIISLYFVFTFINIGGISSCGQLKAPMLEPLLSTVIHGKKIVLASGSARRKEILKNIGLKFDVIPSSFDESSINVNNYNSKKEYVLEIARHKVADVFDNLKQKNALPDFIIGADTIVELNSRIFGKPKDKEQAVEYLNELSGKAHTVHTAVVIRSPTRTKDFVETTIVHIAPLPSEVIKAYVDTNDPMDKAGAYGIQTIGGSLVEKIEGDYFNVMGLPLHRFCVNFKELLTE